MCFKHRFRENSTNLYNNLRYFIRIEITINNPKRWGLKTCPFSGGLYGVRCWMWRFANCFAHVDLTSINLGFNRFTQAFSIAAW